MKKTCEKFVLLFLFFATACASTPRDPERASLHLRVGTGFLSAENYPAAFREIDRARELDPKNPVIHNNLALTYYARDHFADAEKHFLLALELSPQYTEARNNLGRLLTEMKRYEEAHTQLQLVLKDLKYQTPEKGHSNLGVLYMRTLRYKDAEIEFAKALKYNREFCEAHNLYGQSLFNQNRFLEAGEALDRALNVCKKYDEPHYFSALSYAKAGQKDKAIARLKEILALYPNSQYKSKTANLLAELKAND
jgi:Tfp pilus assembly protein PilF